LVVRILIYFAERKKNRENIVTEIVKSILRLSESIQSALKQLANQAAQDGTHEEKLFGGTQPETPLSRKRKRESGTQSSIKADEPPIPVSSTSLLWSVSQREKALLRFVRILNTFSLIEPPGTQTTAAGMTVGGTPGDSAVANLLSPSPPPHAIVSPSPAPAAGRRRERRRKRRG
jgi:hypothetical protein